MHWRPLVVLGTMMGLFCSALVLRSLAPDRFSPARTMPSTAAAAPTPSPACPSACWNGEACVNSHCVWQKPNDVGHVAPSKDPIVGGPFALPKDVSDAIPLDSDRFAVALLAGIEVRNARTGEVLSLVTDAPQAHRLYRVGPVIYATAPQRIFVIDAATTKLLKTIELGAQVGDVVLGAGGRRALASLPTAHAVAILATEYHAEIDRIQFGDDLVGPMGVDDTGKRALTTTGTIPVAGLRDPAGGAVYAFDPSRLASAQDRVRASMLGNPASLLMTPNGEHSYVALRADDKLVPLEWLPSGAVRRLDPIATCREPEQVELIRKNRRAIVRCNEGRAVQLVDLDKREVLSTIPLNGRATSLALAPDGEQALVALPGDGSGFIALISTATTTPEGAATSLVRMVPVDAEPTRVRLAPDGQSALVLSDRSKVVWVIR
jgi:DNA-binding beta-propeller fold protein YncE